jgi:hypothetical protein
MNKKSILSHLPFFFLKIAKKEFLKGIATTTTTYNIKVC